MWELQLTFDDYAQLYAIKIFATRAIVIHALAQPDPEAWLVSISELNDGDADNLLVHNLPADLDGRTAREKIKAHLQDLIATAMTAIRGTPSPRGPP
jgi:hypothetical protein